MKGLLHRYVYDFVALLGFVVWLGGSAYFGWNAQAETIGEKFTDTIGVILIAYGGLNSLVRGVKTEVYVVTTKEELQLHIDSSNA